MERSLKLTEAQEFASLALLHCSYKCSITSWKISFPDNIFLQARLPLWRFSPLSFSKGSSKDTTSMTYYSTLVENHQRSLIALFNVRWDFMDRFSTTVCLLFNLFNLQKKVTLQVNLSMQSFEVSKENIISKAWNALKLKGIKFSKQNTKLRHFSWHHFVSDKVKMLMASKPLLWLAKNIFWACYASYWK